MKTRSRISLPSEGNRFLRLPLRRMTMGALLVGIVAGGASLMHKVDDTRKTRLTFAALAQTETAVRRFHARYQRCPDDMGELLQPPDARPRFLRTAPTDGWGRPLHINCRYDNIAHLNILSAGPSGSFSTDDNLY